MTTVFAPRPTLVACFTAITVLGGLATSASPAHAQNPADDAEALIRQGTDLRHQNQDARALPYFERAYGLARNPRTAAQLGLVKMALGYCVDAERLLDEALAVPDHPWIARNLDTLTQTRANARKNIGEVAVAGTPTGAEVLLNGRLAGKLPLPTPFHLDKGPVEIQIRAPGYAAMTRSLKVMGGANENLWIALSPAPDGAGNATPVSRPPGATFAPRPVVVPASRATDAPTPPPPGPSPPAISDGSAAATNAVLLRRLAWTAAGGAALGLTLGIVASVVATHKTDDFNNHTSPATSATPGAPDCATDQLSDACRSLRDAHDRAKTLAIVGYVGAGVFAVTSATLFMLSKRQAAARAESPTLACAPVIPTPGLICHLAF